MGMKIINGREIQTLEINGAEVLYVVEDGKEILMWEVVVSGEVTVAVPMDWELPPGDLLEYWGACLKEHVKRFRPRHYSKLRSRAMLRDWMVKQVWTLLDEVFWYHNNSSKLGELEIMKILLPKYIYQKPEPGFIDGRWPPLHHPTPDADEIANINAPEDFNDIT